MSTKFISNFLENLKPFYCKKKKKETKNVKKKFEIDIIILLDAHEMLYYDYEYLLNCVSLLVC